MGVEAAQARVIQQSSVVGGVAHQRGEEPSVTAAEAGSSRSIARTSNPMSVQDQHQFMTLSILLAGALDPMAMMAGLQGKVRDGNSDVSSREVDASSRRGEAADRARTEQLAKAMRMAEKAAGKMPRWAKRLIGAVISAVGTIASVITGGASVVLVVAGAILMMAGEIVQTLAEHGVIDPKNGMIAAVVIKILGSICTLGAGAVSAGPQIAASASNIALITAQVAKAAVGVCQALDGAMSAARGAQKMVSDFAQCNADQQGIISDEANEAIEEAAGELKQTVEGYTRAMKRIQQMVALQAEVRTASVSGWA